MVKHKWTEQDDLMILFAYKFGIKSCPLTRKEIAAEIGVSSGSVSYRIANFKAIAGNGSATHYAKLSLEVWNKYSHLKLPKLKELAFPL